MTGLKYQVALSFAGEQRDYVEEVARHLQSRSIAVFYDGFAGIDLWGRSGAEAFHEAFAEQSAYVAMFISEAYVSKAWPNHERRSALSRMIKEEGEYILPVRFDDTRVPGLPSDIIYECAQKRTPAQLGTMIAQKLGVQPFDGKASEVPPPRMTSPTGEVVFDYSSFNGRYVIGSGVLEFETKWSSAIDTGIHVYNDPPSINGVALVRGYTSISQVQSAESLDYTSRFRNPSLGEIVVLRNTGGFYAAIQVLSIKNASRGDDRDELRFRYAIQSDLTDDFAEFINLHPDAERIGGDSRPETEATAENSMLTTPTEATVTPPAGTRIAQHPPLGANWISVDEAWARITSSSLLVEGEHWHRAGFLRARSTAGDERVRWLVDRFSEDCPEAVREARGTEFNLRALLWWIAKEAEVNQHAGHRVVHELPPVPPLVPTSDLGSPPEPGRKWVSLWNASLDLRGSSLLDQRHRSDAAGITLTQAGKEWVEWLVWKFAEDCPDAVRGSKTPDPEFNSKVLWWWIRAQAAARGSGKAVVHNDQTVESRASVASEHPDQDTEPEPRSDQASGSVAEGLREAESTNTSSEVNMLQGFAHILARLNRPAVPAMEEGRWISREAAISMLASSALVRMRLPEHHVSDLAESIGRTLLRHFESQYPESVRNDEYRENLLDWWIDMRTYRQTKPKR